MRKILCMLLLLTMLLPLSSCSQPQQESGDSVVFYYRRRNLTYGETDSVISEEIRQLDRSELNDIAILELYLEGAVSETLLQTFPKGISLVRLQIQEKAAAIMLGGSYQDLTGLDQTIACACLTLTVCQLTGAEQVSIRSENDPPESGKEIVMTPNSITFLDDCKVIIEENG